MSGGAGMVEGSANCAGGNVSRFGKGTAVTPESGRGLTESSEVWGPCQLSSGERRENPSYAGHILKVEVTDLLLYRS